LSDRKLNPLPPDPDHHQVSAIAHGCALGGTDQVYFLSFTPGLIGGRCIGVNPHDAPNRVAIILAARGINGKVRHVLIGECLRLTRNGGSTRLVMMLGLI
jgi:UDP-N-acetyl-D-mannosaminuronate dehydrogenase